MVEIETLFLRSGRIADNPSVDLPKTLREKIAFKLEKSGFASARVKRLRVFVPIVGADRASLFGESLPPGLLIADQ